MVSDRAAHRWRRVGPWRLPPALYATLTDLQPLWAAGPLMAALRAPFLNLHGSPSLRGLRVAAEERECGLSPESKC
eukprot:14580835-Alexandrium_andersonii.AAC.1